MASANPLWRAPRIHGELLKLGIEISERTVSRLLRTVQRSQSWKTFLQNHVGELVATDFFTVPTVRLGVLTSNKLTLALDFTPPKDVPATLDILPISVGTDPGLALATRKGTGYYKVPSLKGVWYRGHYLHEGSAASLEEMFDPDRLKETHVPGGAGGWSPLGTKTRAIQGHQFGLRLASEERAQLIAFLKTL